ncbi:type VII secretion-associated serine protease mycosin [Kitasatospora aureofaciens]|uniref:type VII secretion-associated serine protease mycosin n=1 Tax=Kitasatospora aureofaciens TaxID=1894 RepID=UPI001C44D329|nr:type VII secretion-associated serine protease mycosin [Kitasatospora aureofaciens]MBV6698699.1 type VII secretion-associated serine protease mycosin [Kitasatospora aureofaciens]
MRRTNGRARGRAFAGVLLAASVVAGPAVAPAAAGDSIRDDQWHLDAMHAPEMWKTSTGQGITVAVIDGGFKFDHPDLVGQLLPGNDFSDTSGGVGVDVTGHGTQMASLIAGTGKGMGGKGAYGLAPGAKVLPVKIKNHSEGGAVTSKVFLDQIGQAVDYAVDQGAKVINISQGMAAVATSPDDVAKLNGVLARAAAKGSLVVASVGNSAQDGNLVEYPGGLPYVVGVGAADKDLTTTAESQRGPQVDLVAPGMDIVDACTGPTGYCKGHGTSAATALVSASAALVWAVHTDWTANQVLRVLISTAGKPTDGSNRNDSVGYGAVRPRIALTAPGDPGPADVYPIPSKVAPLPSASPSSAAPSASATSPAAVPAAPTNGSSPAAAPIADKASDSGSAMLPIVIAGVVGLVLVAGVVFFVARKRRAADRLAEFAQPVPPQVGPAVPPPPPSYEPPMPPGDNPYAR